MVICVPQFGSLKAWKLPVEASFLGRSPICRPSVSTTRPPGFSTRANSDTAARLASCGSSWNR